MPPPTDELIALAAEAVALAAATRAWLPWFRGNINAPAFTTQIGKLAGAGNLDRAKKLCAAAPMSAFVAATAVAIDAVRAAPDDEAEATAIVRDRFRAEIRAWVDRSAASWVVIGAAIAGIATAVALPAAAMLRLIAPVAGIAALMLVHTYVLARRLARDAVIEGDRVVAALVTSPGRPGSRA